MMLAIFTLTYMVELVKQVLSALKITSENSFPPMPSKRSLLVLAD